MGNRGNILVKSSNSDTGVYLYTHWGGSNIPFTLRDALKRRLRWDDAQYLTRIIFDELTNGCQGEETGFGISSALWDGGHQVAVVNVEDQTVSCTKNSYSFDQFIKLPDKDLKEFWS